jgi:hypothetical protein
LGASDADGLVAIVISSASKALTATTSIGALKGRSLCNEAVKYARTMSFTLPMPWHQALPAKQRRKNGRLRPAAGCLRERLYSNSCGGFVRLGCIQIDESRAA